MGIVLSKPFSAATYVGKSDGVDAWSFKEGDDFRVKLDANFSATPFAYLKITAASDPAKISDDTNFGATYKVSVDTLTGKLSTPYCVIWNDYKTEGLEKLLVSVYADEKETVLLGNAYLWIHDTSKNSIYSGVITIKDGKSGSVGAILVAPPITGDPDASITFYQWFKDGTPLTLFSQAGNGPSASTLNTLNIGAGEYKVQITVQNSDGFTRYIDSSAPIKISKVENQSPTNLTTTATAFNKNIVAGSVVATLGTTDPDAGNTFTYALVPGDGSTDNSAFTIDGDQLKINASPDFETKSSYSVRVQTIDQGGLTFEKNLTFSVNNVNEAPTNLTTSATAFNENIVAGSVVATLGTTDPDAGNTFTYALVPGTGSADNAAFSITGNQLKINASPNFESKSSYSVRIRTTDQGGLTFEKRFTLGVNDLNETPTNLTPSASAFNEDIAAGSIVATLGTTDPDAGNTFTYALVPGTGSADNAAFSITGNQLKINASPNFESKSSYSVRIRTTDQGGLTFEKRFTLGVNDLIEKTTSSASTVLRPNKDILELTGSKNIFGTGNNRDNTITGNSGRNRITGGLGKDVLTGGFGSDTFFYATRNDSLPSKYDVITDYASGETIACGFDVEGDSIIAPRGTIDSLVESSIKGLLTDTVFEANAVDVFKVAGMSGCFVAINDSNNGFQSTTDTIIHLLNYDIGTSSPVLVI